MNNSDIQASFARIFSFVVMGLEGGATMTDRGADDPGRLTRFGISAAYHPEVDVANLNEQRAQDWYFDKVWSPMQCGRLPGPIALVAFDLMVNPTRIAEPRHALQYGLGVAEDGAIGEKTLAAAETVDMAVFLNRVAYRRLSGYLGRNDSVEEANEKGWAMRVHRVSIEALCWHFDN